MTEEAKNLKTDPLASATRTSKRDLLAACLVAITYRAFNITIEKVPLAGLDIKFEGATFEAILLIVIIYFFLSFILYYYIDIKNFLPTAHQIDAENTWTDARNLFTSLEADAAASEIRKKVLSITFNVSLNDDYRTQLSEWIIRGPSGVMSVLPRILTFAFDYERAISVTLGPNLSADSSFQIENEAEKLTAYAGRLLRRRVHWLMVRYTVFALFNKSPLWTARSAYFLRNYILDFGVPVLAAIVALLALSNVFDVHWLAGLIPYKEPVIPHVVTAPGQP